MAVDGVSSVSLAVRSSVGIELWSSTDIHSPYEQNPKLPRDESKNCRAIIFSNDGTYFAYANGNVVSVIDTSNWVEKCALPRPKASHLNFSPRGTYILTWELYSITKDKPEGCPNMYVYRSDTGEEMFSIVQKKQTDWEPCWSTDESLFALMVGGEAIFYELTESTGFKTSARKLGGGRGGILSIGPGNCPPFICFYTPGTKGAPSMCKIYKYPALQQSQTVACKSFFQADRVEMLWNKRGTGLLLLTSTEVDQTGASYYGKQALHFMATKGESCSVPLAKDGPIHAVQWSPKATEFVVVYGYMPSKATLFNLKCDVIFDFGEGSRNCAYFNNFGNFLAGFGNLRGYIEIWDVNKKVKTTTSQASDSTLLEWSPAGDVFVTATTAPRLRIGNGFKVWHYSGALLHETLWPQGQELLNVTWQKFADGILKEPVISNVKIEGIKSSQPEASKQVYQPPNIRLMKEGKSGDSIPQPSVIPPASGQKNKNESNSNRQRKSKSRRDSNNKNNETSNSTSNNHHQQQQQRTNNKSAAETGGNGDNNTVVVTDNTINDKQDNNSKGGSNHNQGQRAARRNPRNERSTNPNPSTQNPPSAPMDNEKRTKIRMLRQKLGNISKLKIKLEKGEHLEPNQLTKIAGESALEEELKMLKVSM